MRCSDEENYYAKKEINKSFVTSYEEGSVTASNANNVEMLSYDNFATSNEDVKPFIVENEPISSENFERSNIEDVKPFVGENFGQLTGENFGALNEIRSLRDDLESIKVEQASIKRLLDKVLNNQARMLMAMTQTARKNVQEQIMFPVNTEEKLQEAERFAREKKDEMIMILKGILNEGGMTKNLHRIFGSDIIFSFNYDGVNEKKPLKDYHHLNMAIYEANKREGYSQSHFIKELRESIKAVKNRMYKRRYDEKKRNAEKKTKLSNVEN